MSFIEETVESKYLYKGKIINLRIDQIELPNKELAERELIEHNGGACIVAVNENNEIYLVKQYRKPYDEITIEIPAGKLNLNEDPMLCALRELEEEIGYKAKELKFITQVYPSPGFLNEKLHIYFCDDMVKTKQNLDPDEFVEVIKLKYETAIELVKDGTIKDAKTIIGILMCQSYLKE